MPFCWVGKLELEGGLGMGRRLDFNDKKAMGGIHTGNCAIILAICPGANTLLACKNSNSVRIVLRERLICAGSGILKIPIKSGRYS